MKKKHYIIISIFGFFLFLICVGVYLLHLFAQDSIYCRKGSLKYYILIYSDIIKNVPKIGMIGEEFYSSHSAPNSYSIGIMYDSSSDVETIIKEINNYLESNGFETKDELSYKFGYTTDYFYYNSDKSKLIKLHLSYGEHGGITVVVDEFEED
jgi:hypothetical protein